MKPYTERIIIGKKIIDHDGFLVRENVFAGKRTLSNGQIKIGIFTNLDNRQRGSMVGQGTIINSEKGTILDASFVTDSKNGPCRKKLKNGDIEEFYSVNNQKHGRYILKKTNGYSEEFLFEYGKRLSPTVFTYADKRIEKGHMDEKDRRYGTWKFYLP